MIYFVGAGPGDPDLITLKAKKILEQAQLVIYAGSLINPKILDFCANDCKKIDSALLNLEEIILLIETAYHEGKIIVRLHTGDPSIYGAIGEQMKKLDKKSIPYINIPGVSSFLAAAASLKKEYTVPDISQTVIITRLEGRTSVPDKEKLAKLAQHRSSMAIFLSVNMIEEVVSELLQAYPSETAVAVVEKASWPEEKIVQGNLLNITEKTKNAGIKKTALILLGDFLNKNGKSKLYDKDFSHEYRREE